MEKYWLMYYSKLDGSIGAGAEYVIFTTVKPTKKDIQDNIIKGFMFRGMTTILVNAGDFVHPLPEEAVMMSYF